MRRSPLVCLLLAGISNQALADDLSLTSIVKSPVSTATAANNTPGNITIAPGGGVDVSVQGAAVTLNSNNTVDNAGIIQNTFAGGAVGVHIVGGNTGTFVNEAGSTISAGGGGSANIGILLDGPAAFTGNITTAAGGNLIAIGTNSIGVAIQAPLNGNLLLGATSSLVGQNITGVSVTAPISGSFSTFGTISTAGTATFTSTQVDPLSGPAVAIGSSVSAGILNAGPTGPGDSTTITTLIATTNLPTLAIQPSIAGAAATNIVIGGSADAVNPNFSLINRGTIRNTDNDPGVSTIAVQIGETGTAAHSVTLAGGIYNNGTISAVAETDNIFASQAPAASANATGLIIGNGAQINASGTTAQALLNDGQIASSVSGTMPTVVTGILIQPGGSLPSLSNTNAITAGAGTTDTTISSLTAYGIHDLSGSLTSITNSGRIAALATLLDNGAQQTVAIDLSHGGAGESITTSGTILGDVLFGSAGASGGVSGNQLVIEGANAVVQGALSAAPGGSIDVHLSQGGTGGVLTTSSAQITSLAVGQAGTVQVALNKNTTATPVISATGPVNFAFGSRVVVAPSSFLPNSGTYVLIHSNTGLTFNDFTAATAQPLPFIFNGTISRTANDLTVTLQRKTAVELGLTGNAAAIYEPFAATALTENAVGAALLSLTTAEDVQAAINAAVPDVGGGVRALAVAMTDSATGIVGARERGLVLSPGNQQDEFRFWGQEVYNQISGSSTVLGSGYSGAGEGVALGVEWGALPTIRYGIGFTFVASEEAEAHPADNKIDGDWRLLSFYAGWRQGNFFVTPELNIGQANYISRRGIAIGSSLMRTATASWTGYLGSGAVTTGYVFPIGGMQMIPELSVDGLYVREGAYTEQGAGAEDLLVKSQTLQSLRGFLGVITQGSFTWDVGTLQPQLLLGWSYDFMHKPGTFTGNFATAPDAPFQLTGPSPNPNRLIAGLGLNYAVGNWSAGINFDAALSQGNVSQSATFNLSSRF